MCGRFVSSTPPDQLASQFHAQFDGEHPLDPSYNVAPTNDVWSVLEDGSARRLVPLHWGLVPSWAKDPSVGNRMINARAETLAEKASYKSPFKKRRCIIPADGFFEWKSVEGQKKKQPYFMRPTDGQPFAFAGLWSVWRPKDRPDEELRSCTVITGAPNSVVADIHDRMPVILPASAWDTWLDSAIDDTDLLGKLLVPAAPSLVTLHPVSTAVNNVRDKGAHLIDPFDPHADAPPTLL